MRLRVNSTELPRLLTTIVCSLMSATICDSDFMNARAIENAFNTSRDRHSRLEAMMKSLARICPHIIIIRQILPGGNHVLT